MHSNTKKKRNMVFMLEPIATNPSSRARRTGFPLLAYTLGGTEGVMAQVRALACVLHFVVAAAR